MDRKTLDNSRLRYRQAKKTSEEKERLDKLPSHKTRWFQIGGHGALTEVLGRSLFFFLSLSSFFFQIPQKGNEGNNKKRNHSTTNIWLPGRSDDIPVKKYKLAKMIFKQLAMPQRASNTTITTINSLDQHHQNYGAHTHT